MNQNRKSPAAIEPHKLFSALRLMIGKEYIFKNKRVRVDEVSEIEKGFHLMTSIGNFSYDYEMANAFVAETFPIENILPQATPSVLHPEVHIITKQEGMIDDMTEVLYDVFKIIKQNPTRENIEQATTLSNTANTIGNMMKLRLQANKLLNKK